MHAAGTSWSRPPTRRGSASTPAVRPTGSSRSARRRCRRPSRRRPAAPSACSARHARLLLCQSYEVHSSTEGAYCLLFIGRLRAELQGLPCMTAQGSRRTRSCGQDGGDLLVRQGGTSRPQERLSRVINLEQVVELVGLAAGLLEGVPLEAVPSRLEFMAAHVQQRQPGLLRELSRTQELTDEQREVRCAAGAPTATASKRKCRVLT